MIIKQKNSINKIGKYLREISVSVIGVAITLSASYWIGITDHQQNPVFEKSGTDSILVARCETSGKKMTNPHPSGEAPKQCSTQ